MLKWTPTKDRPLSELTPNQAEFARQILLTNGNATQAAINAGYSITSASQRAYELRQNPRVQAAINKAQRSELVGLASIALSQAKAMLLSDATPPGARVELIKTVMDRAGLAAVRGDDPADPSTKDLRELSLAELQAIAVSFRDGHVGTADRPALASAAPISDAQLDEGPVQEALDRPRELGREQEAD